jgi:hypothetical protein
MRKGISFTVTADDRRRLDAIVAARSAPQKHVWRARIFLFSDAGSGTSAIMAASGKPKTCVWRRQERFLLEGVAGLLRDKTRPFRIAPVTRAKVDEVITLTLKNPPHEASHWTVRAMAKVVGLSASGVHEIWKSPLGSAWAEPASLAAVQTVK